MIVYIRSGGGYWFTSTSTSNSVSVSDSNSVSVSDSQSVSDSLSVSNSTSASVSTSQSVSTSESHSDSLSVSDSESVSTSNSVSQSPSLSESVSDSNSLSVSVSESESTSDSASQSPSISTSNSFSDSESHSDSLSVSDSNSLSVSNSNSVSDSNSMSVSNSNSESESTSTSASAAGSEIVINFSAYEDGALPNPPWGTTLYGAGTADPVVSSNIVQLTGERAGEWDWGGIIHDTAISSGNQWASVTINSATGGNVGVLVRCNGSTTTWYECQYESNNKIAINKIVAGAYTNLSETVGTYSVGSILKLVVSGDAPDIVLTAYYNDVQVLQVTGQSDIPATSKRVGLSMSAYNQGTASVSGTFEASAN